MWIRDAAERMVSTFVQTFIGLVLAAGLTSYDLATLRALAIAAIPAALSVLKSALATKFGDPGTAGLVSLTEAP